MPSLPPGPPTLLLPTRSPPDLSAPARPRFGPRGHEILTSLPLIASLLDLHVGWAWVVIIANGLAGLWALGAARLPSLRTRALWWFTVLAQLTMFVQVLLGVELVANEKIEAPQFHMFYGFVGIIAIGILYSYRQQMRHRLYLLYGFGSLFIMGLAIRALLVGSRT